MKIENSCFKFILLFQFLNRKSMFPMLHSHIDSQVLSPSFKMPDLLEESNIELEA
jgi:hypothetical protein